MINLFKKEFLWIFEKADQPRCCPMGLYWRKIAIIRLQQTVYTCPIKRGLAPVINIVLSEKIWYISHSNWIFHSRSISHSKLEKTFLQSFDMYVVAISLIIDYSWDNLSIFEYKLQIPVMTSFTIYHRQKNKDSVYENHSMTYTINECAEPCFLAVYHIVPKHPISSVNSSTRGGGAWLRCMRWTFQHRLHNVACFIFPVNNLNIGLPRVAGSSQMIWQVANGREDSYRVLVDDMVGNSMF